MATKQLAIHGGKPIAEGQFIHTAWPPVCEATAEKLKQLYLSRAWSFNSPKEQEFEQAFAAYHGAKHGIFMTNGTVTLECALKVVGVGPGDEVIVPALTWIATAAAVKYVGAKVVFADIEPTTAALDPADFEARITPRTKAVIPVHLYGGMADLDRIIAIAKKHNIAVIEDCAHMQGGKWRERGVGSWGDVGSFSFQQSKTLSAGESGICLTNDDKLAELLYRAKHIGYSRYDQQGQAGTPPPPGLLCHNYRGLAFCAQILLDQLEGLSAVIERYNAFTERFRELSRDIAGFQPQAPGRMASPQGYYAYGLIFAGPEWDDVPKARILQALRAEGIPGLNATYGPVYKHLLFNLNAEDYRNDGCPVADRLCERMIVLMHQHMTHRANADLLAGAIHKIAENRKELCEC
ncbi:MAG: DegT/DnrJ/EryC1/StrS family aminotransferase [Lentisphaerae bacterium]|nr:DegT/DnrJ/EryC1/StrS family aminotransferase [Lentisphaerota bacterium]